MKKIIKLVSFFVLSLILIGCSEASLDQPKNLRLSNDNLIWDSVEGADGYLIYMEDKNPSLAEENFFSINSRDEDTQDFDLTLFHDVYPNGSYDVYVIATLNGEFSMPSEYLSYEIVKDLQGVTNVRFENNTLTWDEVEGATNYAVEIFGETFLFFTNYIELPLTEYPLELIEVKIYAYFDNDTSEGYVYELDNRMGGMDMMSYMLYMMNPSYKMNMTQDDFDSDEEFQEYQQAKMMIDYYTTYTSDMDELDAASFFGTIMTATDSDNIMNDPISSLFELTELSDLTPEGIASMIFDLLLSNAMMENMYYSEELEYYMNVLNELDTYLIPFEIEGVYGELLSLLENSLGLEVASQFNNYLGRGMMIDENYHYDYQFNYYILYETIYLIQESLEFQEKLELPMYDNYEYFTDFQNLIVSSYNSMNQELLDFLSNEEKQYELENYSYLLMEYVEYYSWIGEFEQIVQDSENILLLEQDRESIENSLAVLIEYIFLVQDSIESPLNNLIDMIENDTLTNTQIINIKDQIVYGIYENLPSKEVLSEAFEVLLSLSNYQTGEVEFVLEDGEILANNVLLSVKLFAEFMYMIDVEDLEELLDILDRAESSPSANIDILVFGAQTILNYYDGYQETIMELKEANLSIFDSSISNLLFSSFGEEFKELFSLLVNVNEQFLLDYMRTFVSTKGELFKLLIEPSQEQFSLNEVITQLLPYSEITVENLDDEVLKEIIDQVAAIFTQMLFEEDQTANDSDNDLSKDVAVILNSSLRFIAVVLETLGNNDLDNLIFSTIEEDPNAFAVEFASILVELGSNEKYEALFNEFTTSLSSILTNQNVLETFEMSQEDSLALVEMVVDFESDLFEYFQALSQIDLSNITEDNYELIEQFYIILTGLLSDGGNEFEEPQLTIEFDSFDSELIISNESDYAVVLNVFVYGYSTTSEWTEVLLPGESIFILVTNVDGLDSFDVGVDIYSEDYTYLGYTSQYIELNSPENLPIKNQALLGFFMLYLEI